MNERIMLTLREAAEAFGLSYYFLRQLALSGSIPAVRAGRSKILVNRDGLTAFLANSRLTDKTDAPQVIGGIRVLGGRRYEA